MIFISPYRRPSLCEEIPARRCALLFAPAFYKGDASQSQESNSSGAQTGGASTVGSGNQTNSGTQIGGVATGGGVVITKPIGTSPTSSKKFGWQNGGYDTNTTATTVNTGTQVDSSVHNRLDVGNNSTVTVTDGGAVKSALDSLAEALGYAQTTISSVTQNALNAARPADTATPVVTVAEKRADDSSTQTTSIPWKIVGGVALVAGAVYLIFFRKKTA